MSRQPVTPLRFSVRLSVVSIVLLTTLITAAVAIGLQYHFSRQMAIETAVDRYQLTAANTGDFIQAIDTRAAQIARLLARYPRLMEDEADHPRVLDLFAEVMRNNPIFFNIYLGFDNGDFYEVVNLENHPDLRASLGAQAQDRWAVNRVRNIEGQRQRQLDFYAADFTRRSGYSESSNYDPRSRPWFLEASAEHVNKSSPYMFRFPQVPGQTYSIQLPEARAVLAIDITLQSFSDFLRQQRLGVDGEIYVYRATGELLASNRQLADDSGLPEVQPLPLSEQERDYIRSLGSIKISNEMNWPPIDFAVAGEPRGYSVDLMRLLAQMLGLQIEFVNGFTWSELVELFAAGKLDLLQPVISGAEAFELGLPSESLMALPQALALHSEAEPVSSLRGLHGKTLALPEGWTLIDVLRQHHPQIEVVEVESTRAALEAVRDRKVFATLDASAILRYTARQYFIQGLVFIEEPDAQGTPIPNQSHVIVAPHLTPLLPLLNRALSQVTREQRAHLHHKWLGDSAIIASDSLSSVPYLPLIEASQNPAMQGQLLPMRVNGETAFALAMPLGSNHNQQDFFAVVVAERQVLAESLDRVRFSIGLTLACLMLLLPASWVLAQPIVRPIKRLHEKSEAVRQRRYDQVQYIPSVIKEIDALSKSMFAMAKAIQQHEQEQRELMESFIQLIASAIDEKSPYTGGHCLRVPELALMLADAAAASTESPFKDFCFKNDEEYREFRIAAWLHDCGKITVPEHIVDKGSKLECIYNRIHEIRMRFEVLWRDAEIAYLKQLQTDGANPAQLLQKLEQERAQLQQDFAFVANTNVGGEFLSEQAQARLQQLAEITWVRHFDDRLGLSPVDELRFVGEPGALPATERLLADKPEHIIPRHTEVNYDPRFGIKVEVPEHLYNLGEVYNLSIARGTLTAEDRFKINEHIISTIRMLESLPFPKELARVPRYASTHHETMKGTGYPRRLTREQLSIPERFLVLADIFEALTAADRPYKKAKSVSASLDILHKMVQDEHVDRDVFEFFLRSGVYRRYAERFLTPNQLDEVDISRYLA